MLAGLITSLFVFGLVILVHEFGHFVMAKRFGIKVLEFGIGYPPRIATLAVRDGVEYTLNAIPVGGFVRMLGEEDPTDPQSFARKSARVRIATLLAGSVMNLVLAALVFAGTFAIGEQVPVGSVFIESVAPGSPAQQAGMQPGDIIASIQDHEVRNFSELVQYTQSFLGQEVSVALLRQGESVTVQVVPRLRPPSGEGAMGIVIGMKEGFQVVTVRHPVWKAIPLGVQEVRTVLAETAAGFARMIRVGIAPGDIAGPVGILQIGGAVAQSGFVNLLRFIGLLSVNLFVINLLPFPMLDGGRIAFVLLEKIRGGKRVTPERESLVHLIGLLVLLGLMVVVSYFDIQRILGGGSLTP
jgi:regulator of sigma E protease